MTPTKTELCCPEKQNQGGNDMKSLYRSRKNRKIAGVCGGLGEYFNVDPTLVRLAFAALSLAYGGGLLLYVISAILVPDENTQENSGNDQEN